MNHFRQSPSMCGPASLKILLSHYGKGTLTEEELAKISGANVEEGTEHSGLIRAVESLGGRAESRENATIEEVKNIVTSGTPVMVGYEEDDGEEHYAILYDMEENHVILMDPQYSLEEGGDKVQIPIKKFIDSWHDSNEGKPVGGWYLRVQFDEFQG